MEFDNAIQRRDLIRVALFSQKCLYAVDIFEFTNNTYRRHWPMRIVSSITYRNFQFFLKIFFLVKKRKEFLMDGFKKV